jgi:hypothetical protein
MVELESESGGNPNTD